MSSYYPPVRERPTLWPWLLPLGLSLLLLAILAWRLGFFWTTSRVGPYGEPRPPAPRGDLAEDEKTTIALYQRVAPSVVHITSLQSGRDPLSLNWQEVRKGTGTGFIWSDAGHVVTNSHVVEDTNAWQVMLADRTAYKANLIGYYADKDLAVLQINAPASKLRPIEVGTSDDLQVGQKAFAIGNPFGLDQTLTTGVVSALNREIESVTRRPIRGVIQTDAAINPGNSGGPLLDSYGRLIGVNTAIFSPSGASVGIGFAIPVDEVNRVVPQIIKHGKVIRPGLGIQVATDRQARQLGVTGVLVLVVHPSGPAAKAKLRPTMIDEDGQLILGDEILEIDGKQIRSNRDLFTVLEGYNVGDMVRLKVRRDGQAHLIDVALEGVG